jgi:dethiobiotin synthetase
VANRVDPNMLYPEENIATLKARLSAPLLGVIPHLVPADAARAAVHLDTRALLERIR